MSFLCLIHNPGMLSLKTSDHWQASCCVSYYMSIEVESKLLTTIHPYPSNYIFTQICTGLHITSLVWVTELFIYYFISQSFGEEWTNESYLLLAGMLILFYGVSIYNAPNAGSILLNGRWYSLGIDCSREYEAIRREKGEADKKSNRLRTSGETSSTLASYLDSDSALSPLLEYEPTM